MPGDCSGAEKGLDVAPVLVELFPSVGKPKRGRFHCLPPRRRPVPRGPDTL